MSDWEDFADDDAVVEDDSNKKKFADEELVDDQKEEREKKERAEEKKKIQEEIKQNKKEKVKEEKDYEKMFQERNKGKETNQDLTREEIRKNHPEFTEAQIDEEMSRREEGKIGDNLFENDTTGTDVAEVVNNSGFNTKIKDLKGEKNYKQFARDVAEFMTSKGQNHNHIPKFFSELFHSLSEKITTSKMSSIVRDFDTKLKKRKADEEKKLAEEKKLEKKSKGKKKAGLAGVSKGADTGRAMMDDVFDDDYAEGDEDDYDYGDEGDNYVERDEIDFM